jgi:magnesium-transporting ATPase (P-type)
VVAVGLSHLTRNEEIFACADVAVGIDILQETADEQYTPRSLSRVTKSELEFVQSISSQSCAFRLRGASSVACISTILEKSRASLDAAITSTTFLVYGCVAFSLYVLFSACAPSTSIPYIPTLGSAIYLLVITPCVGMAIQMSEGDENNMKRVPPKNDRTLAFTRSEKTTFYVLILTKAVMPALLPQILHLIVFGELVIKYDPAYVALHCPSATNWVDIVRCDEFKNYTGTAKSAAGSLVLVQFMLCVIVASAGFVHRYLPLNQQLPWERNINWLYSIFIAFGILVAYVLLTTENGTAAALPWHFYLISITTPFVCVLWVELCKRQETKQEQRAEKLRRLQFETRLGAWSPR